MEMWAQDVAAMTGYDVATAAAGATQTPFSTPPLTLFSVPEGRFVSFPEQLFEWMSEAVMSQLKDPMTQLQLLSTPAQFAMEPMNQMIGQAMTGANALPSTAGSVPAMNPVLASAVSPAAAGQGAAPAAG
ncbi:hypothetical protein ATCCBAA256_40840, partial [Mycobacterium montefiorense]